MVQLAFTFDAAQQFAARLAELPPAEIAIHVITNRSQFLGRGGLLEHDHAVAHHVVARDQHHQDAPVGERDKLDLIEFLGQFGNGGGDADVPRKLHQNVGGALDALADGIQAAELILHAIRFAGGHAAGGQRAHEETEGLLGGHPAGGRMRLREVALVGEVCHHIADGRGTEGIRGGASRWCEIPPVRPVSMYARTIEVRMS